MTNKIAVFVGIVMIAVAVVVVKEATNIWPSTPLLKGEFISVGGSSGGGVQTVPCANPDNCHQGFISGTCDPITCTQQYNTGQCQPGTSRCATTTWTCEDQSLCVTSSSSSSSECPELTCIGVSGTICCPADSYCDIDATGDAICSFTSSASSQCPEDELTCFGVSLTVCCPASGFCDNDLEGNASCGFTSSSSINSSEPCSDTFSDYPMCNGVCPSGQTCRISHVNEGGSPQGEADGCFCASEETSSETTSTTSPEPSWWWPW